MNPNPGYFKELRTTLVLAFPIMAGQVGQMMMGLADTLMVGRVGTIPLAACALANTVVSVLMVFGIGLLTAVSVQVSHAHGRGHSQTAGESLRHGLGLSLILGVMMLAAVYLLLPALPLLGQDPAVVSAVGPYLEIVGASLIFFLLGTALKNYTEACSSPWPAFWITLGGVILNIVLNAVLIFGLVGFPALGLWGAGIATFLSRAAIFLALLVYVLRSHRFRASLPQHWLGAAHPEILKEQFRLGLPVAFQLVLEVGAFGAASLILGGFGAAALAAHQVALTCAATVFMVPLGLAMATTVRVGQIMGAGQFSRIRRVGYSSLAMVVIFMGFSAGLFLLAGGPIARNFLDDPSVILLTTQLLVVAGIFQLFDGVQVVGLGALRGMKDVRIPAGIAFSAYWILALPLGWFLAYPLNQGPVGVWWGLALGLAFAAVGLVARFHHQTGPGKLPTDSLPSEGSAGNLSSPIRRGRGEMADAQA
jgi:multidrug resistance protein, MATE family